MKITYFGHSCFRFDEDGYKLVIDPFKDVDGYNDVKTSADMVLVSHDHFDHNAVSGVKRKVSGKENPFNITMMQTFHDVSKIICSKCGAVYSALDLAKEVETMQQLIQSRPIQQ